jgi:hypothetical protein
MLILDRRRVVPYENKLFALQAAMALALAFSQPVVAEEVPLSATVSPGPGTPAVNTSATPPAVSAVSPESAHAAPLKPPLVAPPVITEGVDKHEIERPGQVSERQAAHEKRLAERMAQWGRLHSTPPDDRWKARRAELSARYQDLRRRAIESGLDLPEMAPWETAQTTMDAWNRPDMPSAEQAASRMPPQEGADASSPDDQPDWEHLQAVINGMTPEEREACMIVHRFSMGSPMQLGVQQPAPPPRERHYGGDYGYAPGYGAAGPGYGQGYTKGMDYNRGAGYGQNYDQGYYSRGMNTAPNWQSWQGYSQ